MGEYTISVVGESFKNEDGTPRQKVIRRCRVGDPVALIREPDNPYDENAVAVVHGGGQIGYIGRDQNHWLSRAMDDGAAVSGEIQYINGAGWFFARRYGVVLLVRTGADA